MEFSVVPEDQAQRIRQGPEIGWFGALRDGKMIQMSVRPTLSKYQQSLVPDQRLRSRQAHDAAGARVFYIWLDQAPGYRDEDFPPPGEDQNDQNDPEVRARYLAGDDDGEPPI